MELKYLHPHPISRRVSVLRKLLTWWKKWQFPCGVIGEGWFPALKHSPEEVMKPLRCSVRTVISRAALPHCKVVHWSCGLAWASSPHTRRGRWAVPTPWRSPSHNLTECHIAPFSHWHPSTALTDSMGVVLISPEGKLEGERPWESPVGGKRKMAWKKSPGLPSGGSKQRPQGQLPRVSFFICCICWMQGCCFIGWLSRKLDHIPPWDPGCWSQCSWYLPES